MTPPIGTRAELLAFIAADPALLALLAEARTRDADAGRDPAHDAGQALRVALWTLRLGGAAVDAREAVAAALLHDAVDVPKNSPKRASASERSADMAARRLPLAGFAPAAVERVVAAIRDHSFSRGAVPTSALGGALQDADRLEALGAIGLLRWIATSVRMGAGFFDSSDPWARSRPLDDRQYSVDHFFTKLLTLPTTMRTVAGRAEAQRRAAFLRAFLSQLGAEVDDAAPE